MESPLIRSSRNALEWFRWRQANASFNCKTLCRVFDGSINRQYLVVCLHRSSQMSSKKKDNEHWGYIKEWGIEGELHLKRPEDRQEDHRYDEKGDG